VTTTLRPLAEYSTAASSLRPDNTEKNGDAHRIERDPGAQARGAHGAARRRQPLARAGRAAGNFTHRGRDPLAARDPRPAVSRLRRGARGRRGGGGRVGGAVLLRGA